MVLPIGVGVGIAIKGAGKVLSKTKIGQKVLKNVIKNGIRINIIGNMSQLPKIVKTSLQETMKKTSSNKNLIVNLAINYGSKNEIAESLKKINKKNSTISEKTISKNLNTKNLPDPDILIRTGGRSRLSNFMLWQLAYTELYFLKKLWPDFNINDLKKTISHYKSIKRNFGAI